LVQAGLDMTAASPTTPAVPASAWLGKAINFFAVVARPMLLGGISVDRVQEAAPSSAVFVSWRSCPFLHHFACCLDRLVCCNQLAGPSRRLRLGSKRMRASGQSSRPGWEVVRHHNCEASSPWNGNTRYSANGELHHVGNKARSAPKATDETVDRF